MLKCVYKLIPLFINMPNLDDKRQKANGFKFKLMSNTIGISTS